MPTREEGFSRFMANYFTIGDECRNGFDFEQKKNMSHPKDLRSYLFNIQGLFTLFSGLRKAVSHLDYVRSLQKDESSFEQEEEEKTGKGGEILFRGPKSKVEADYYIEDYGSIIMNNLKNFMGGRVLDMTEKTKGTSQLYSVQTGKPVPVAEAPWNEGYSVSDGKLEMSMAPSLLHFPFYNFHRVHQPGPLEFKFMPQQQDIYFQVDGEFYFCERPDSVALRHCSYLTGGQLNVLARES